MMGIVGALNPNFFAILANPLVLSPVVYSPRFSVAQNSLYSLLVRTAQDSTNMLWCRPWTSSRV